MILPLAVSAECLARAQERARRLGTLRRSVTHGDGNVAGYVGQQIAAMYTGAPEPDTYDFDILVAGLRLDVKTLRTNAEPQEHYGCTVFESSLHQNCDGYVFARVRYDYSVCWLLGWMRRGEFLARAVKWEKGRVVTPSFTAIENTYECPVSGLSLLVPRSGVKIC